MELTPAAAQYQKLNDAFMQSFGKNSFEINKQMMDRLSEQFAAMSPEDKRSLREDSATKMRAHIQEQLPKTTDAKARAQLQQNLSLLDQGLLPSGKGSHAVNIVTGEPVKIGNHQEASTFARELGPQAKPAHPTQR